jgi:hypothetical protein
VLPYAQPHEQNDDLTLLFPGYVLYFRRAPVRTAQQRLTLE